MFYGTFIEAAFESIGTLFDFSLYKNINKFWEKYYGVDNLSCFLLEMDQFKVLGKGLKYCPTSNRFDHGPLIESINRFFHSVSLHLFFQENISTEKEIPDLSLPFEHPELKLSSDFNPQMPSNLEYIHTKVTERVLKFNPMLDRPRNLTNREFKALFRLADNNDIIIKKADKGSNIVIQNKSDYIEEGNIQLLDTKFYKVLDKNVTKTYNQKMKDFIKIMYDNKEISDRTYAYLMDGGTRTSIFYMLPKIHKSNQKPRGRPIVSSIDCPTERLSKFLDILLQPYVLDTKSYIRDTPDFIKKIENVRIEAHDWFLVLDVVGLYTHISHDDGISAIAEVLSTRDINSHPSTYTILKMLELVLTHNNFTFNKQHYLQINGTAMGTRVAPTYANLFMSIFEKNYIYKHKHCPKSWYHFIDDIWSIFRGTEEELLNFTKYLNSVDPNIKFTFEYSKESAVFLDIMTKKHGNQIHTELYTKPTDNHTYLDFNSCHPYHIKQSIPHSQILRVRRNCTNWHDFLKHALHLISHFQRRNYPEKLIRSAISRNSNQTQKLLLSDVTAPDLEKKFFLIVDYNPTLPSLRDIIQNKWRYIERSSSTRILKDIPIIFGYRKPKCLADHLVSSDIKLKKSRRSF